TTLVRVWASLDAAAFGAGASAGAGTTSPQRGHFAFFPASVGGIFSNLPQPAHVTWTGALAAWGGEMAAAAGAARAVGARRAHRTKAASRPSTAKQTKRIKAAVSQNRPPALVWDASVSWPGTGAPGGTALASPVLSGPVPGGPGRLAA